MVNFTGWGNLGKHREIMSMEEAWIGVLRAIVGGPRAWSTSSAIAEASELDIDQVSGSLSDLSAGGWVDPWQDAWTLTPFAAEYLGVRLCEFGLSGRLRWSDVPPSTVRPKRERPAPESVDELVDHGPSPATIAEANEERARWRARAPFDVDRLPWPTILLMGCSLVWTERQVRAARKRGTKPASVTQCGACHNLPLKPGTYCLRCDRWHLDGVVAKKRREKKSLKEAG